MLEQSFLDVPFGNSKINIILELGNTYLIYYHIDMVNTSRALAQSDLNNTISVTDGPDKRRWSHKIITEQAEQLLLLSDSSERASGRPFRRYSSLS